jgi:hypothetical protein
VQSQIVALCREYAIIFYVSTPNKYKYYLFILFNIDLYQQLPTIINVILFVVVLPTAIPHFIPFFKKYICYYFIILP